jgi:hypothetical protein
MKFRLRTLFLITTVTSCMLGFIYWNPLDGRYGAIRAYFSADATEYAAGYSDRAFRSVRVGMKQSEVYALLGEPLWKYDAKFSTVAGWTSAATRVPYRQRVVEFEEGAVIFKRSEFNK